MGALIASHDWAATPLGPIVDWPSYLKTTLGLMLRSPVPLVTLWGEAGIMIYNDAYAVFAGQRHPQLLGSAVREGWPEVADFNDNVMRVCLAGGTLSYRDKELTLYRQGAPEQLWLNLDYSPVLDEAGAPAGVIAIVVETTGKVRAEQRLMAERKGLRRMIEQAPGFFAMLSGPDYIFTMANAALLEMVNYRDLYGKPLREALPEMVAQGFLDLLDKARDTGEPFIGHGVRVLLRHKPGAPPEERFVDFIYQPVFEEGGAVSGILVQGHDVTEQKRGEAALRESEARFRLVSESAPVMLWMGDASGKCVYLNEALRAFWGVAEEKVGSFDWSEMLHPEDRDALFEPFGKAMAAQEGFVTEARFRRADGEYRLIRTRAQPRFDAGGGFVGMIGVNVDITESRKAEQSLRRETRILEILNKTGAAIAAELDLDTIVQMVTDAGVELTGAQCGAFFYNVLDAQGDTYMLYALSGPPRDAFAKFPMPRATAIFRPTFEGAGIVRSDDITQDERYGKNPPHKGMPPGHLPIRSYLAVPVISRSGEVLGGLLFGHEEPGMFKAEHETLLVGIAGQAAIAVDNARLFQALERELAERRRAEEALQALNATLEGRVAIEVAEHSKTEEALRQAQKMEAIGKLTGGVAHDFNNLLQVVSGNLQLLAKDVAGNERSAARVSNALAGVARGAKLASQLLAFGRRQALEPKVVNIGRLVTGMEDMLRRSLGEGIEIETMVSGGLWNTLIDPGQLENALLNLAINGRDAMQEFGKLTIEVGNAFLDDAYARSHPDVAAGQYVMLAVTDTGSGMPADILAQVFEPFFSTKAEGRGSGLGLSMVYGFVKQSGGHVKLYSEVGQGTTVKLYLPRSTQMEDMPTAMMDVPASGGSETILVAEDDDEVRATVVEMLSDLGYRVLTAKNAAAALTVIESGVPIDLLFTDVVMPGALKSPELARKAVERQPGLAVLFTSGYTENSIVHGGRLDPGVELLPKPYTREAMARKIRHVLANGAQRHRVGPRSHPLAAPPAEARSLTVLLCEDDMLIRMSTAEILQAGGMIVLEAGSAREALDMLAAQPVDILVTDVSLPDMSGPVLATQMREMAPGLPLIFATGHRNAPGLDAFPDAAVMIKPYDDAELLSRIRQACARPGL
ncbi:hypothetical protein AUP43_10890 [Oceanibaculum pacificum]|uniref:histidine kinase n=2 Tax=Oceanibaculum pacificum TaxID=580166 RepID=A0A154VYR0_9PROT|nr:hypothetical protein AUP43_10890 [Oceanibaculum pacificum]